MTMLNLRLVFTMQNRIRFGAIVMQDMPFPKLVELWQKFDELGFDNTWLADHFVNYAHPNSPWLEGWTTLSALAAMTKTIRIGTLVTSILLRNPAVLARQAMTVDVISGGRLEIGIGAGAPGSIDPSYKMIGSENWSAKERIERLREQVVILDKMLSNEVSTFEGRYYKIDGATMQPGCIQKPRPPLTIAAHLKASLDIVAEYADSWSSFGSDFGSPAEVIVQKTMERINYLEKACERIGRDPGSITRSLLIFGREANFAFASEEHFIEIVERYTAIGINELIFFYPFFAPDQISNFDRIALEVIPGLRGG